jgi:hypothetical protein
VKNQFILKKFEEGAVITFENDVRPAGGQIDDKCTSMKFGMHITYILWLCLLII